jgi:hypothetical protein
MTLTAWGPSRSDMASIALAVRLSSIIPKGCYSEKQLTVEVDKGGVDD